MGRKRNELTDEFIRDYWLKKGHGIDTRWLINNEPDLIKTSEWYKKYAVSQDIHDEWYEWAINEICRYKRCSKKFAERDFAFEYLNLAPSIIKETKDERTD